MVVSDSWLQLIDDLEQHYTRYGDGNLANQIIKIQEELGEVAEAYVGYVGINPRKGITHDLQSIAEELADVIVTAALAIRYAGFGINQILEAQEKKTRERLAEFDGGR